MLSCSVWFCAPSFGMGGGLESRCVGRVYGADGAATCSPPTGIRSPDRPARSQSLYRLNYRALSFQ